MMDLKEYYSLLHFHDWLYEYSDDPSIFHRGKKAREELKIIAKQSPQHANLFDAFKQFHFAKGKEPPQPFVME